MNFASIAIGLASLACSFAALAIAGGALRQAKTEAARARKDWAQRKWFDLYQNADEAANSLELLQAEFPLAPHSNPMGHPDFVSKRNDVMLKFRQLATWATVFPQNPEIDRVFAAASFKKSPEEALSPQRLEEVRDAVEGLRVRARVNPDVLLS